MTKQRLEGDLSEVLGRLSDKGLIWKMKLQVNQMAHTVTPADFLVLSKDKRFLIECKQCKGSSFPFARFTQFADMCVFESKFSSNCGYLLLCFWKGRKDKSLYYLLSLVDVMKMFMDLKKKSANEKDLANLFKSYSFKELEIRLEEMFR